MSDYHYINFENHVRRELLRRSVRSEKWEVETETVAKADVQYIDIMIHDTISGNIY